MAEQTEPRLAKFTLGYTPPSLNHVAGGNAWTWRKAKAQLQQDLGYMLLTCRLPRPVSNVHADARLYFATSRRRDEGNYRAMLEKALGDALMDVGVLTDDTPDRYRFGAVEFATGKPGTLIVLTWRP
jgi:hypothetical protein